MKKAFAAVLTGVAAIAVLGLVATALASGLGSAAQGQYGDPESGHGPRQDTLYGGGRFGPGCSSGPATFCLAAPRELSIDAHANPAGRGAYGTLTQGKPRLRAIHAVDGDGATLLTLVASAQQGSEHPLADASRAAAAENHLDLHPVGSFARLAGRGFAAVVDGKELRVGNLRLMQEIKLDPATLGLDPEGPDETRIYVAAAEGKGRFALLGTLDFGDQIRPEAMEAVEALKAYPAVNARIDGQDVVYHHYYDIGVAVSTEKGLMVPVLRDCERRSFADVEKGIGELAIKARDGKISVADLQGGTFTITNGGIFGSMMSTPILNPPQSAILGMHAIQKRAVVLDDQVVIRPMMYLALSYDHRIIDGREAVSFLVRVKECVENPERLLLGV